MAKAELNPALLKVRGHIGQWVYKHYGDRLVVTRRPTMQGVKWSPAQLAHREKVRASGAFYRAVKADPGLRQRYQLIADERGVPLSAVTLEVFMKQVRASGGDGTGPAA